MKRNVHINNHLQGAWNKYGKDNFIFYIIEYCDDIEDLKRKEIYYIKKHKANDKRFGYNKTIGGDGLKNPSFEISEKMSKNETLNKVIQLSKDGEVIGIFRNCKFGAIAVGNENKKENIRNCCDKRYGYKTCSGYYWMYEKDYLKNGFNLSDYKIKNEFNRKTVLQFNLSGELMGEYESARECNRQTGIGYKIISEICNGKRKTAYGFTFKFK